MRSFILRAAFTLLVLSFTAFAQQSSPTPPLHPATATQIEKLMALTHATDTVTATIKNQIEIQKKQGPQIFPDAFWTDMQSEFAKVDWVKIATQVYQRYFSEEEAEAVITFYSKPVGQKVLESSQVMTQELSSQGYTLGTEIGKRVAEKYKDQIEANMKKLQKPDAAPSPQ